MKIAFIENVPENLSETPILISGKLSLEFNKTQFLSMTKDDGNINIYEIRYEYHCSPFRQAEIFNNIIIVGHEENCYIFDVVKKKQLSVIKLYGYFGHIYLANELIYIADANGLYCINQDGIKLWVNNNLGIDGVIIDVFGDNEITGKGELDPPDGWEEFSIDKETGEKIISGYNENEASNIRHT